MDFGATKCHDFDLNIPYVEDLNMNAENEVSPMNTPQGSQNNTEGMNITVANNGNKEVHQSSAVDTTPTGLAFLANTAAGASSDDIGQFQPKYIASLSLKGRRRYRRRGQPRPSDPNRFCTNYDCKTRTTPLWRRGPLGPKTLCNACGIYYKKVVTSGGSDIPTAIPVYDDASAFSSDDDDDDDDASPNSVPAETEKGVQKGPRIAN